MSRSIGTPQPDGPDRRTAAVAHRDQASKLSGTRGHGTTSPNGEETDYGLTYALSFHKGLPHDVNGLVRQQDYHALVRILVHAESGAVETLPARANRRGAGTPEDPQKYATGTVSLGYRGLISPFTGHVYELQGADAGDFGIAPAPRLDSDELAAELAEVYAMALLRDVSFLEIEDGSGPNVSLVVDALDDMPWFNGGVSTDSLTTGEVRRFATRHPVTSGRDLFRGSTPGSVAGSWLSQFLLVGTANDGSSYLPASANPPGANYRRTRLPFGHEDGFVAFGAQVLDQRAIVAAPGIDYMTNWASWLDVQNGVDFTGLDVLASRRRYLATPRDVASYVHVDALYQAYLVACLIMLSDAEAFPFDSGLPETSSRTREPFASFGAAHVLSLVTEVATRALKAVWRQKWLHHRRARPEVVAALLTLHANDPSRIPDPDLSAALSSLLGKLPAALLSAVAAHNTAQNAASPYVPGPSVPAEFPVIADAANYLLPMAFPEGSPTHPSYGAGHATVAGACVTVLKAFFEMFDDDGSERGWPLPPFVADPNAGTPVEGGELVPDPAAPSLSLQGELDKLAANISIGRNMAGVHYYTDYFESVRLGERIAVAILEEQASLYEEPVAMRFTSFDGEDVEVVGDNGATHVRVSMGGTQIPTDHWYGRYAS